MSRPLYVVIDTNVFSPEHFEAIERSPLIDLCRRNQIYLVYGHIFLEELYSAYGAEKKRQFLLDHWLPFVKKTVVRFCEDFYGIFNRELVQGHGQKTNVFMRPLHQRAILDGFENIPMDGSWNAWIRSKPARELRNAKRAKVRETSKELRAKGIDLKKQRIDSFAKYCDQQGEYAAKVFIPFHIDCKRPNALVCKWIKSREQFPFVTQAIENILYLAYHAMARPNAKIDLNAEGDLDLMTHLLWADILVTNETGFMSEAFNDLWKPRNKKLLSTKEFVSLLNNL